MNRVFGTFYRYRSFPAAKGVTCWEKREQKRRIKAMFEDRVFWFANPSTLNDPFDCRPVLLWSDYDAENRKRVEETLVEEYEKANGVKPNAEDIQPHVEEIMRANRTQAARNEAFWDAIAKKTGVLCMSRKWDIAQQWTYYAAEHSGFCMEFDIGEDSLLSAFQMAYVDDRPQIDLAVLYADVEARKDLSDPCILTKATAWQHEEEVRILNHNAGNIEIPEGVLNSITFGIHTSEKNIEWLRKTCLRAGLTLDFYKCRLDDHHYALDREPL